MQELVEQIEQYEELTELKRRKHRGPIANVRTLGPWRVLGRRPVVAHDTCLVLLTSTGELEVVEDRLPATKWTFGHIRKYFEVDMKRHRQVAPLMLPCKNDILKFRANLEVHWRVVDPEEVVRSKVTDGAGDFAASAGTSLRRRSRDFDLDQLGEAEEVLNDVLARQIPQTSHGIEVIAATLEVDHDNMLRAHELMKRRVEQSAEIMDVQFQHADRYVRSGLEGMLAYHLAQNPTETLAVLEFMAEQEDKSLGTTISVIGELIGSGVLQDADAEREAKGALQNILDRFRSVQPRLAKKSVSTHPTPGAPDQPNGARRSDEDSSGADGDAGFRDRNQDPQDEAMSDPPRSIDPAVNGHAGPNNTSSGA